MAKSKEHVVTILSPLRVEICEDGFNARVLEPIIYNIDGHAIEVLPGWETDWASVPRLMWRLFPPMGRHTFAAILHDYLYEKRIGTRKRADRLFLIVMESCHVPYWRRWAMYYAVRWFGARAWRT